MSPIRSTAEALARYGRSAAAVGLGVSLPLIAAATGGGEAVAAAAVIVLPAVGNVLASLGLDRMLRAHDLRAAQADPQSEELFENGDIEALMRASLTAAFAHLQSTVHSSDEAALLGALAEEVGPLFDSVGSANVSKALDSLRDPDRVAYGDVPVEQLELELRPIVDLLAALAGREPSPDDAEALRDHAGVVRRLAETIHKSIRELLKLDHAGVDVAGGGKAGRADAALAIRFRARAIAHQEQILGELEALRKQSAENVDDIVRQVWSSNERLAREFDAVRDLIERSRTRAADEMTEWIAQLEAVTADVAEAAALLAEAQAAKSAWSTVGAMAPEEFEEAYWRESLTLPALEPLRRPDTISELRSRLRGRDDVIHEIAQFLEDPRWGSLVLKGLPGCGKSRLAVVAASMGREAGWRVVFLEDGPTVNVTHALGALTDDATHVLIILDDYRGVRHDLVREAVSLTTAASVRRRCAVKVLVTSWPIHVVLWPSDLADQRSKNRERDLSPVAEQAIYDLVRELARTIPDLTPYEGDLRRIAAGADGHIAAALHGLAELAEGELPLGDLSVGVLLTASYGRLLAKVADSDLTAATRPLLGLVRLLAYVGAARPSDLTEDQHRALRHLSRSGMVQRRGDEWALVPDTLRLHVVRESFTPESRLNWGELDAWADPVDTLLPFVERSLASIWGTTRAALRSAAPRDPPPMLCELMRAAAKRSAASSEQSVEFVTALADVALNTTEVHDQEWIAEFICGLHESGSRCQRTPQVALVAARVLVAVVLHHVGSDAAEHFSRRQHGLLAPHLNSPLAPEIAVQIAESAASEANASELPDPVRACVVRARELLTQYPLAAIASRLSRALLALTARAIESDERMATALEAERLATRFPNCDETEMLAICAAGALANGTLALGDSRKGIALAERCARLADLPGVQRAEARAVIARHEADARLRVAFNHSSGPLWERVGERIVTLLADSPTPDLELYAATATAAESLLILDPVPRWKAIRELGISLGDSQVELRVVGVRDDVYWNTEGHPTLLSLFPRQAGDEAIDSLRFRQLRHYSDCIVRITMSAAISLTNELRASPPPERAGEIALTVAALHACQRDRPGVAGLRALAIDALTLVLQVDRRSPGLVRRVADALMALAANGAAPDELARSLAPLLLVVRDQSMPVELAWHASAALELVSRSLEGTEWATPSAEALAHALNFTCYRRPDRQLRRAIVDRMLALYSRHPNSRIAELTGQCLVLLADGAQDLAELEEAWRTVESLRGEHNTRTLAECSALLVDLMARVDTERTHRVALLARIDLLTRTEHAGELRDLLDRARQAADGP